jgi:Family of unknown function (DUF5906)
VISEDLFNKILQLRCNDETHATNLSQLLFDIFEGSLEGLNTFTRVLSQVYPENLFKPSFPTRLWKSCVPRQTPTEAFQQLEQLIESPNSYGIPIKALVEKQREIRNWIYVENMSAFYLPNKVDTREPPIMTLLNAINKAQSAYPDKSVNAIRKILLTDPAIAHVEDLAYEPGLPVWFEEKGSYFANTWVRPNIERIKNHPTVFLNHLEYLFPDDYQHLVGWMAYLVQARRPRIRWVCVLTGGQGIGKSIISDALANMLGINNVVNPGPELVAEKYNKWVTTKQLCIINEIDVTEKEKDKFYSKLKTIITESRASVREMREDFADADIVCTMLFTGNHRGFLKLSKGERRYCVMHSDRKKDDRTEEQDKAYYGKLVEYVREKLGEIYDYLMDYDLSKLPLVDAPETQSKNSLMGSNDVTQVSDVFESYAPMLITKTNLVALLNLHFPERSFSLPAVSKLLGDFASDISRIKGRYYVCRVRDYKKIEALTSDEKIALAKKCEQEFVELVKQGF